MRLRLLVAFVVILSFGAATAVSAHAMQFPIRAAFYYPWFPETWGDGSHYHPVLGRYDSGDPAVIDRHIRQMQHAGVQAAIGSWWGPGSLTDGRFPALLDAARGTKFRWAAYYEVEGYQDPSVAQISADLTYLDRYSSRWTWLHVGGRPVLFVYGGGNDGCAMAFRWDQANAGRYYVVLKVFPGYLSCPSQPQSWHQYAPAIAADAQLPFSYSISPGFFFSQDSAPRLVRDPARFAADVDAMVASGARWQLVTTFNEWGEGTAVEPATEWGRRYLDILAARR